MMPVVMECQEKTNARKVLQSLFTSDVEDILPDQNNRILRVYFLGLRGDSYNEALENLIDKLDTTNTIFQGTDLKMV